MELDRFLNTSDSARAARTLAKLSRHGISRWALTGGLAIELHISLRKGNGGTRPLHDIDFVTASFDHIPETLGDALLMRHIHPYDPPAKNMMQGVDPETRVRLDVFRAYGSEMLRAIPIELATVHLKMISLPDLAARHARLCWDLHESKPLAPKYAWDFLRLLKFVSTEEVESVWQEHRKPHRLEETKCPATFAETVQEVCRLINTRSDLLVPPTYSTNVKEVCQRCHETARFRLADAGHILSLLGYC